MEDQDPEFMRFKAQTRRNIVTGIIRALDLGGPPVEAIEKCSDRAAARRAHATPPAARRVAVVP